ncbi:SMC5-SMC6 complex component [Komagataella phaffii CBS 7435]|uniref:Structural maintenance of chromosomes protein 5 n=2 Tax=Komagataella phaffii TaxID=460519 RepID=C4QWJ2_KOMPG|nr:Structural maintenance of chromosomes (SMC) protein [Komagataella phaffii GS115]AOA61493.1 GQ67_02826T0 [Komagataella phaffii]CAH2446311.1 SMC5-SMC6 complex component [Komagataella phaffii CBS 7435]AOA65517.1 GQ68_02421T0 [Komagataella phaffii GS115]CAY67615.1 Structural maintenance of chromosomes (SMC) protein [Komagataella phaffii GS115]CCA36707.1 SMC5-SMC6 complex component [Komagataella phaffii CBS 7435]
MGSLSDIDFESHVTQPSKRRRINGFELDAYQVGAIIRLRVKNFQNTGLSEFQLNPRLNFIVGPNGSGKSSFVNAVCLGLGGKLEWIAKEQLQLKDFIRNGCDNSFIEIEFKGAETNETLTVRRSFNLTNRSTWTLNGKETTEKMVKERCKELNIQLDNLCQFLPQERVSRFSELKPEQVLYNVLRSYGNGELLEDHKQLIELEKEQINVSQQIKEAITTIEELKTQNLRLKDQVSRYQEYQKIKDSIMLHRNLKPFVELEDLALEAKEYRTEYHEKKKAFQEFTDHIKEITEQFQNKDDLYIECEREVRELKGLIDEQQQKVFSLEKKLESYDDQIDKWEGEKPSMLRKIEGNRQQLQDIKVALKESMDEMQSLMKEISTVVSNPADLDTKLRELHDERKRISARESQVVVKLQDIERTKQRELKDQEDQVKSDEQTLSKIRSDKIFLLDQSNEVDLKRAVLFFRENKTNLSLDGKIFEPAILSVNVDDRFATHLEKCVPRNTLLAFTCVDTKTLKYCQDILRNRVKVNVPLRVVPSDPRIRNRLTHEQLKEFGFSGYLSDFITGEQAVVDMLISNAFLDVVPVSLTNLEPKILEKLSLKDAQGNIRFRNIMEGRQFHELRVSSYGSKQVFSKVSFINDKPRWFTAPVDMDRISRQQQKLEREQGRLKQLQEEYDELERNRPRLKEELEQLTASKAAVLKSIAQFKKLKTRHEQISQSVQWQTDQVKKLQSHLSHDRFKRFNELNQKISDTTWKKVEHLRQIKHCIEALHDLKTRLVVKELKRIEEKNRKLALEKLNDEILAQVQSRKNATEKALDEYSKRRSVVKAKQKELQKLVVELEPSLKEKLGKLTENLKKKGQLTMTRLNHQISMLDARLPNVGSFSEASTQKLRLNEDKIAQLEELLPNWNSTLESLKAKLTSIEDVWVPKLETIVNQLSTKFTKVFHFNGREGEIHLIKGKTFSEWKIHLVVKFTHSQVSSVFSSTRHSGGEKSFTTAMFLSTLQSFTQSPFRIVDEINQGLDETAEAYVHKLIIETSCYDKEDGTNPTQYFLITPKLLTNLTYHRNMSTHCIFSGRWYHQSGNTLGKGVASRYVEQSQI